MTKKEKQKDAFSFIKIFLVAFPAYVIFLSYLYLEFFYSVFQINIFRYITIDSMFVYSISKIGSTIFISSVVSFFLFGFLMFFLKEEDDNHRRYVTVVDLLFYTIMIGLIYVVQLSYIFQYFSWSDSIQITLQLILSLLFSFIILMFNVEKRETIGFIAVIVIISSSFMMLNGHVDAKKIKDDYSYTYLVSNSLKDQNYESNIKLIGKVGDHYFLQPIGNDSSILIRKYGDFRELNLKKYP